MFFFTNIVKNYDFYINNNEILYAGISNVKNILMCNVSFDRIKENCDTPGRHSFLWTFSLMLSYKTYRS